MRFQTLHDLLSTNARDDRQITLIEGDKEERTLSFRRLQQRALAMLGALQRRSVRRGDAMILCLGDNERFLEMFWACVLGGIVPVPLAPGSTDEHRRKLLRVFAQLGAATTSVYTDQPSLERLEAFAAAHGQSDEAVVVRQRAIVAGSLDVGGEAGQPVAVAPEDLAFIQFSSGSTGEPKGVLLTHRNLTANVASIIEAAAFTDRDLALSWMPLSHDMGLIGFHLTMLACSITHAIMRTDLFARRPLLWLEKASEQKATILCSPNFGYQHYLRQFEAKRPVGLDLTPVRLVFNGAEPISAELCRQFAQTLAPHGLKAHTLFPVYGLAEASLAVSFPPPGRALETVYLARNAQQVGSPVQAGTADDADMVEFVLLGQAVPGTGIRIVDGAGAALEDGRLGHVLMRGENVSAGYYGQAASGDRESEGAARSADAWTDTGDLGLFLDGQLVITGRAKDLIIVNGQNYYPDDIERIAAQVAGVEGNRVVAASVPDGSGGSEVLTLFVIHRAGLQALLPTVLALRAAVSRQTGLDVAHVVPVNVIPKTTSGKLQRHALVKEFALGRYTAVLDELEALMQPASHSAETAAAPTLVSRLLALAQPLVPAQNIEADTNLLEINLNSLTLARIHEAIEKEFPQKVEITDLFEYPTLGQLAELLEERA